MAFATGGKKGVKSEINVTPLVDVVLVLLIIFMVVTPMLQRGKSVKLPVVEEPDEEHKQADPMVVAVTADGKVWVDKDEYDLDALGGAIADRLRVEPGRKVLLKGDESLTYGDVRKVMEVARTAGAKGVALGVEHKKDKGER
ncbi:MAG: biopolymer transporter ExbD [Myxococcales bacterium]|nr:biopolymer transporter ExbD [Myxococcales bacterium]